MNRHRSGICCRRGISSAVSLHEHFIAAHLPQLSAVPGVACARRYRSVSGTGSTYFLALYEMENERVMGTAAWSQAANTEWTHKLRPHFKASINLGTRCRTVCLYLSSGQSEFSRLGEGFSLPCFQFGKHVLDKALHVAFGFVVRHAGIAEVAHDAVHADRVLDKR